MNTKICTSVEQSEKLLSLGLDPDTADMFYNPVMNIDNGSRANFLEAPECVPFKDIKVHRELYMPVWSLTAILELMPVCINDNNYFLVIEKDETYLNEPIWRVSYKHYIEEYAIVERNAPLINAVFETVCWLIEQGHIKVDK